MFYIDITPSLRCRRAKFRWLYYIGSLLFVALAMLFAFYWESSFWLIFFLVIPIVTLIFRFALRRIKYFFSSTDQRIIYRVSLSFRGARSIKWESVQAIRIGPAYLRFLLKGRKRRQVALGWLSYALLRELKVALEREARQHGVEVVVVQIA